jgi:hypothetical protein
MTCQRCGAPLGVADRYCTVCSCEVRDGDMIRLGGYDVMVISLLGRPWMGG